MRRLCRILADARQSAAFGLLDAVFASVDELVDEAEVGEHDGFHLDEELMALLHRHILDVVDQAGNDVARALFLGLQNGREGTVS